MAGYYSRFTTWVMGYTTKKAVYPMEWAGLSSAGRRQRGTLKGNFP